MRRMAMAMAELDPDVEQAGRVCDWFESRYRPDAPGLEVGDMTWTETR